MRDDKEMTDIMTLQISIIILTLSCMGNGITDSIGGVAFHGHLVE